MAEGEISFVKIIQRMMVRQFELTRVIEGMLKQDILLMEAMCQSQGTSLEELQSLASKEREE